MQTGLPELPPSPLAGDAPQTAANVLLPWSTLLYALQCGVAACLVGEVLLVLIGPARVALTVDELLLSALSWPLVPCLLLVCADHIARSLPRSLRWGAALGLASVLPGYLFLVEAATMPAPWTSLRAFVQLVAADGLPALLAGAAMGAVAAKTSGRLWRLPLVGCLAGLLGPLADAVFVPGGTIWGAIAELHSMGFPETCVTSVLGMAAMGLTLALGLEAARLGRTRRSAPTTA